MKDPTRWRAPGGAAPPGARELLARARGMRPMTAAERSRSAARIAGLAAVPVAGGVLVTFSGIASAAGISAVGAALVVGGIALAQPAPEPLPPASKGIAVAATRRIFLTTLPATPSREPVPKLPPTPTTERAEPPPRGKDPHASKGSAASRGHADDALRREAALLEEATALLNGNPNDALARLELHGREFPQGRLALERQMLTVDALRRIGRVVEARTLGNALVAQPGGSLYAARLRSLLEGMP